MLFVFPEDGSYGFWMKDMLTSIDMIWLADDGIDCEREQVGSLRIHTLKALCPSQPVRYVLETKAGFFDRKRLENRHESELSLAIRKFSHSTIHIADCFAGEYNSWYVELILSSLLATCILLLTFLFLIELLYGQIFAKSSVTVPVSPQEPL